MQSRNSTILTLFVVDILDMSSGLACGVRNVKSIVLSTHRVKDDMSKRLSLPSILLPVKIITSVNGVTNQNRGGSVISASRPKTFLGKVLVCFFAL